MRVSITEPRQTSVPSNVEPEAKLVVVVASWGGEARRQRVRLGGRAARRNLLGVVHKNENEKEMLDIQKREGSGCSKSEMPIGMKAAAMETMERTAEDLHGDHNTGQNSI
jgi:hypothetical protein